MSDTAFAPSVGGVRSILPVLAAALLLQVLISLFQLDFAWTRWLYEQEGGHWLFREHWLFSDLIHSGGRRLSALLALICIGLYAASFPLPSLRPSRHVLAYLAVAPLLASTAVSVGKNLSGVDCPWSLYPFGGDVPYRPLLQQLLSPGDGACFPAGHASAGYAWFALYFAASGRLATGAYSGAVRRADGWPGVRLCPAAAGCPFFVSRSLESDALLVGLCRAGPVDAVASTWAKSAGPRYDQGIDGWGEKR